MSFAVVIPSKLISNLVPCLQAVWRYEPGARVIVVNDGLEFPDEESKDFCHEAQVIQGERPFVFSQAINSGIRAAGEDDVIALNDDALLLTPGGFSLLAKTAAEHPEYGVIAAACNNVGNQNQWPRGTGGLRYEPRMLCFTCVHISRKVIDVVGLLDENFKLYGLDDDDLCLRVRKAGFKLAVHDGCIVDHTKLMSTFRGPARRGGDFSANLEIFKKKWGHDNWGRPA